MRREPASDVPDLLLDRYHLGELPRGEAERLERRLPEDPQRLALWSGRVGCGRMQRMMRAFVLLPLCVILVQSPSPQPLERVQGTYQRITVHGTSLEGNLSGDSPDRAVSVYLPPGYATNRRRYPVVYMLHGFTDSDDKWFGLQKHFVNVPAAADTAAAAGAKDMIVVMPNAFTVFQGSFYSNSVTTGDWERFVTRDLVADIDRRYRTLATRESRGIAGHSMGGYGTLRIAMKYPEVLSAAYVMSPCCLAPMATAGNQGSTKAESVRSLEEVATLDFGTKAALACAAAWSPNPRKPPLFLDLPTKAGELQPAIAAKWTANAPIAMLDQHVSRLRAIRLAIDVGDRDRSITTASKELHAILDTYEVPHQFEVYEGDHVSGVMRQLETKVFPFFAGTLVFK